MKKSELVMEIFKDNPGLSNTEIAEEVGCTTRLVRKVLNPIRTKDKKKIEERPKAVTPAKILIFDIETAPMEVYVWGLYKQRINPINVIKDWSILSWSAKWLFDPEVMSERVTGKEAIKRDDTSILPGLWSLMDEADIIIGHNCKNFDIRKSNLRFKLAGMVPPSSYRVIDTQKTAQKVFSVSSYKMDYLNKIFGNKAKLDAPYSLWVDSVNGSDEALKTMEEYNRFDVVVNEELYLDLRPWIKSHPNVNLYQNYTEFIERCSHCGSDDLVWSSKYYTPAGRFKAFRCSLCGAIGRSRFSDLTTEERKALTISLAS